MVTSEMVIEDREKKRCSECWQEVSDILLNEVVVIGLECNEIQHKIKLIEKFISRRWSEIKNAKPTAT